MPTPSLLTLTKRLRAKTAELEFRGAAFVYAPLEYAWPVVEGYVTRFGEGKKRVLLVGMNPGPFGMAQTGVPFGEVSFVRDWMKLDGKVGRPDREHPKRPVLGFGCARSEVSGRRLWSAFAKKHPDCETFFRDAYVLNYCPLLFLGETGANLTPDKLPKDERAQLEAACDKHLGAAIEALGPDLAIGVGQYAAEKIESLELANVRTGSIPHPSPANPAANKDWEGMARKALQDLGVRDLM